MAPRTPSGVLTAHVSREGLALLREHDFPCSEALLATATPTRHGIRLRGSRGDFDMLVGFVAGEANHSRRRGRAAKARIFDEIADELECVLAVGPGARLHGG